MHEEKLLQTIRDADIERIENITPCEEKDNFSLEINMQASYGRMTMDMGLVMTHNTLIKRMPSR